MNEIKQRQCLLLIGFMGCGKSTVGRSLAKRLHWDFLDLDHLIEHRAGKPITEIFAESGESGFRALEREALVSAQELDRVVIATGGGIVTCPENIPLMRDTGFVIWLDTPEEEIFRRVSRSTHRPLLHTEDPRETVAKLFAAREPLYRAAAECVIPNYGLNRKALTENILKRVRQYFGNTL